MSGFKTCCAQLCASFLFALVASAGAAHGTADGLFCAVVKPTLDGFAALREGPGVHYRMIQSLVPLEIIVIYQSDSPHYIAKGPWKQVESIPRLGLENQVSWVNERLVYYTPCPRGGH